MGKHGSKYSPFKEKYSPTSILYHVDVNTTTYVSG